jgi:hypothetical protein
MYLVHVHLWPHPGGCDLPDTTASVIADCGSDITGFEHVSVHSPNDSAPVVGIYLRAPTLEAAELAAESLWRHSCTAYPWLCGWKFRRAEAPLMMPEPYPWNTE